MQSKESAIEIANRVYSLAQKLIEASEGMDLEFEVGNIEKSFRDGEAYKFIAKVFLYNATDDYRAILILIKEKLFNAAFMALRRLFEFSVDLQFIGKQPEERTKSFFFFESIQRELFQRFLERHRPDWTNHVDAKTRESIRSEYERAMKALGYKKEPSLGRHWSKYDLKTRCEEIRWVKLYDLVYRLCCIYAHPSPRGLGNFLDALPGGGFEYIRPEGLQNLIIGPSAITLLYVLEDVNRILGMGLDEEIKEIRLVMKANRWSQL